MSSGSDVESCGFDASARAGEGCGKDDRVGESQSVGGVWFGGIDVDPVVTGKGSGVEPGAVGEERIAAKKGDGGLEVEAACDGYGDDFVIVRREDACELANAFGVAAFGDTDEKFAADAENIAALKGARKGHMFEFAKFGNGFASEAASGRRDSVPSGKMTASSSRTMAGSSTNMESGRSGSAGRETTRAPSFSRSCS